MTVVNCPKCREQVRLPVEPDSEIQLRCPLCSSEFCSLELAAELPPLLVVLDPSEDFDFASAADTDAAFPVLPGEMGPGQPGLKDFEFATSPPPSLRTKRASRSFRDSRRKKNPAIEVLKVVGGGIVGLAIGQLILWWVVGKDPLDAGPRIARVTPWAVPDAFRGISFERPSAPTTTPPNDSGLATNPETNEQFELPLIEIAEPSAGPLPSTESTANNTADNGPLILRPIAVETSSLQDHASEPEGSTRAQDTQETAEDDNARGDGQPTQIEERTKKVEPETVTRYRGDGTSSTDTSSWTALDRQDTTDPVEIPVIEIPTIKPEGDSIDEIASPVSLEQLVEDAQRIADAVHLNSVDSSSGDSASVPSASVPSASVPSVSVHGEVGRSEAENVSLGRQTGPLSLAEISMADFESQLQVAESAAQQWDEAGEVDVPTQRRLAAQLYRAIAETGDRLVRADGGDWFDEQLEDRVRSFFESISRDEAKRRLIEHGAPSWIAAKGPGNGVVVLGTVRAISRSGDLLEVQLELQPNMVHTVVSRADQQDNFRENNTVLVLGKLVATPRETLAGYTGTAESVIWGAFHCADPSILPVGEPHATSTKH